MYAKKTEERPILAICYDFDKTLSPDDMQAQGYIQKVYGGDVEAFWKESNTLAKDNCMDTNLAWMFMMIKHARGKIVPNKDNLMKYGSRVELFPGVQEWFERIRAYGDEQGITVEHYIISSGLKEMIEGTSIASKGAFKCIYASSFYFDETGVPIWPAQAINYTNKTQFLFRIEKGILDINDSRVNDYFAPEDLRVPFRNIVYIGDSDTDIPCMKLVNANGGHAIAVYNNESRDKTKAFKMLKENRIKHFAPTDYTEGSPLDILVKDIINRTAHNEKIERDYYRCLAELKEADESKQAEKAKSQRINLISSLARSGSFSTTHEIVKELVAIESWEEDEIEWLCEVALENTQVFYILKDTDITKFYKKLLGKMSKKTENSKKVAKEIEK